MTPEEFATEHGLSIEEATLILSVRARGVKTDPADKLAKAKAALAAAQKRVGVHPVVEGYDELLRAHDPAAEVGLERFYSKGQLASRRTVESGDQTPWVSDVDEGGME